MKRKQLSNSDYSFSHTCQRIKERYNLNLNKPEYDRLCDVVRSLPITDAISWEDQQGIFGIPWQNTKIIVVYDLKRDLVTTVLPPEQFNESN